MLCHKLNKCLRNLNPFDQKMGFGYVDVYMAYGKAYTRVITPIIVPFHDITFRQDPRTLRPRVNKKDSQLDKKQKSNGNYFLAA